MDRSRFSFLPPSCGDRLLSQATSCKLELLRLPSALSEHEADDGVLERNESDVELSFELRGDFALSGRESAELLIALVREFRRPLRGEKGGAA
jgi:hypothetical protein